MMPERAIRDCQVGWRTTVPEQQGVARVLLGDRSARVADAREDTQAQRHYTQWRRFGECNFV